jgi:hypothetical protein
MTEQTAEAARRRRVAILSIPRYLNYGTQLQAFALQHGIRSLGYDSRFLDYQPPPLASLSRPKRVARALTQPHLVAKGFTVRLREKRTERLTAPRMAKLAEFSHQRLDVTAKRFESSEALSRVAGEYDAFVVGSDQLWSPLGHLGEDAFFLPFAPESKRIAYAPSIGVSKVEGAARQWLSQGVSGIPYLSVREKDGAEIIEELTGRTALVVVDPTMLVQPAEWNAHLGERVERDPYLLCYFLQGDAYARDVAETIARRRGLKLIMLPFVASDLLEPRAGTESRIAVGPFDFARLIRDASFVCTDSFHGTVFSVLFRREFHVFRRYDNPKEAATFSRMRNLLGKLALESRACDRDRTNFDDEPIDFDAAHARLADWRTFSLDFLRNSLASAAGTKSDA